VRWVASPRLGLGGERLDVAQLAEFPVISFSRHSGPHATIERLFAAVERPASINCITSVAAMIRLVADGFGVAALPPAIIGRELQEGALELLDVEPAFPTLPLVATYRTQGLPLAARIAELASEVARATPSMPIDTTAGTSMRRGAAGRAQAPDVRAKTGKDAKAAKGAKAVKDAGRAQRAAEPSTIGAPAAAKRRPRRS